MSADELRRRTVERLSEARDKSVEYALNVRFRPSVGGDKHIPATTAEEIALQTLEGSAMIRAYTYAIEVINDTFRRMHQPDDDKVPEQRKMETY